MATYRDIATTETDPQAPVTSALMKALDANVDATAEGAADSPVNSTGWHPYDMVFVGDGTTGKFYDFAVDGLQATITTPTFVDGYDYLTRWENISHNNGPGDLFQIAGVTVSTSIAVGTTLSGFLELQMPTLEDYPKTGFLNFRTASGSNGLATIGGAATTPYLGFFNFSNLATALTSVTFRFQASSIDAGKAFLYRRRNFISG